MDRKNLQDLVAFSADGPTRATLHGSDQIWSEVISLQSNQETEAMADASSDALFVVVAGEVVIYVDRSFKRLHHWDSTLAPAGAEVVIKNAGGDPAIILVVAAPPPASD